MKKVLSVLWVFIKTRIKGGYEYRMAFWIDAFSFILGYGSQALLMVLLVKTFDSINGWKPFEVMLLYAYTLASYTLINAILGGVMWDLSKRVRSGDFDQTLTKPMHPLIYEVVSSFSEYYFLHFLMAIGMIAVGVSQLDITLNFGRVLNIIASVVGGALIQGGVLILFSTASFFLINNPLSGQFYTNIRTLIEYPLNIYPMGMQFILSTIIPLALVSFYPVQNLTGRADFGMFPPIMQYCTLPVGIIFFYIAYTVWTVSTSKYKSTGS